VLLYYLHQAFATAVGCDLLRCSAGVDARYQEWLEKNKVQHTHSDSEDETEQMQKNRHKRFGQLLSFVQSS